MVEESDLDRYVDERVVADGTPLGTVVDVDREEGEFVLEPSPEVDENTWEELGWNAGLDYEDDWERVDYERWQSGDEEVHVDLDWWPYTLDATRVEEADDGELEFVD
ncbi:hypothetical protein [Halomicrobium salinisoli]|uniref:hypothetical protein n=1 Tax=Halomicrobium salinisoli TaxID=2878391 RepID=UPI001CF0629F|nr:hypothetical protein [Halomicrobium salinisoli]